MSHIQAVMAADAFTPEQQARLLQLFREWQLTEPSCRRGQSTAITAAAVPANVETQNEVPRPPRLDTRGFHRYAGPDREIPPFVHDRANVDKAALVLKSLAARFKYGIKVNRNETTPRGYHVNTVAVPDVEQWPDYKRLRDLDFDGRFAGIHPEALAAAMAEDRPHHRGDWAGHKRWSIWNFREEVVIRYFH